MSQHVNAKVFIERDFKIKFQQEFNRSYLLINGYTMPSQYKEKRHLLDNFEVFEDDIWVCSFPSSGAPWIQEIIWLLMNNFDYESTNESIYRRFGFLEMETLVNLDASEIEPKYLKLVEHVWDSIKWSKKLKKPRLLTTHLPWSLLPKQIANGDKKPRIIYITRNPKNICETCFEMFKTLHGYKGNLDDFAFLFINNRILFAPFWKHLYEMWNRRDESNILFLTGEEMKYDLSGVVRKLGEFLGVALEGDQVERLVSFVKYESIKVNAEFSKEKAVVKEVKRNNGFCEEDDEYVLSSEWNKKFDKWIIDNTKATGFVFK